MAFDQNKFEVDRRIEALDKAAKAVRSTLDTIRGLRIEKRYHSAEQCADELERLLHSMANSAGTLQVQLFTMRQPPAEREQPPEGEP